MLNQQLKAVFPIVQRKGRSMENHFSTDVLRIDQEGELLLDVYRGKISPGSSLEIEDSKVLLAGGFPAIFPDSSLPLSPTLKLNSDLTSLRRDDLQNIAEAELLRFQGIDFNLYQVDADYRLCVIADSAQKLDEFVDTYGGVLEIEPLLTKKSVTEYPYATELSIEKQGSEYRISYKKDSPIDFNRCSYCGECGRVCPEKCIAPDLRIDRESCTFCRECEKVCIHSAIDVHGAEETVLRLPAIVLLGEVQLELPERDDMIFSGNNISEYFKTLYSCEIKEVVCHNNTICQYSGRLQLGCGRCIDSCEYGALSRRESGIVIDHMACQSCGNCIAACPTGAMQNGYFKDDDFLRYIGSLKRDTSINLVLGEEQQLHNVWWFAADRKYEGTMFLEYQNMNSITCYHLLALFVSGCSRIVVLHDSDSRQFLLPEIAKANTVSRALFSCDCAAIATSREFLQMDLGRSEHPLATFASDFSHQNRRKGLSQLLQLLLSTSRSEINVAGDEFDFVQISCESDSCTHCFACLNECKTLALQTDEDNLSLQYSAGNCVGCGICVGVCPERVLRMDKAPAINSSFFKKQVLAQSEPASCKGCGKVFGSRKSLDRVMQILAAKEAVNSEHFEYCGACRVVNIFEAEKV